MKKFKILKLKQTESMPKTAGVYSFWQKNKIIYIGKAINIQSRVKNHFSQPSYRDNLFIDKIDKIGFIKTGSEISALILEANLIKEYQPKYNVVWKDDKNYFYVAVVENKNKIPYVFITHQLQTTHYPLQAQYIGPFVDGNAIKKTLRFLRKIFPYYISSKHFKLKCGYCHLDLCPGPNPDILQYKKNIKKLILVLQGKSPTVLNLLKKEMKQASDLQNFETAGKIRDKIRNLEQVMSHYSPDSRLREKRLWENWEKTEKLLQNILEIKNPIQKIECYDVSNIQGKFATASMIVFTKGKPDKNEYKKFKIKMVNEPNDIAMLKETLIRRFTHREWTLPQVILIDGGKAQLNVAINSKPQNSNIKVISIAKGRQELFIENKKTPIPLKELPQEIYNLIVNLDNEAHRFAINYHKKLRKQNLLK